MDAIDFSKNSKLNKVLNSIYADLLQMCDTEKESILEIKRYASNFKGYPDYNLYIYGNLLIYYHEIRKLYSEYKRSRTASDYKIEDIYMKDIRYVANYILSNNK